MGDSYCPSQGCQKASLRPRLLGSRARALNRHRERRPEKPLRSKCGKGHFEPFIGAGDKHRPAGLSDGLHFAIKFGFFSNGVKSNEVIAETLNSIDDHLDREVVAKPLLCFFIRVIIIPFEGLHEPGAKL